MKRREFLQLTGGASVLAASIPMFPSQTDASSLPAFPIDQDFFNPPKEAGPWAVWHWTSANQTKEGVTADLEGMAEAGIAGASLFSFPAGGSSFRGPGTVVEDPAQPLTPNWFDLVNHAVYEAERVGITLALQISAGWATAGGSWIEPEDSQQQLVWSETGVQGGSTFNDTLPRPQRAGASVDEPESWRNYYHDLAVLAFPVPSDWGETNSNRDAEVDATLPVLDIDKLTDIDNRELTIESEKTGYIQFSFKDPFTLRSVRMNPGSRPGAGGFGAVYNRPAHSMEVQASDDGENFRTVGSLEPMGNSWQTRLTSLTHSVPQTTARYFRLVYHPGPPIGYDEHMQAGSYRGSAGLWESDEDSDVNMLDLIDPLLISSVELSSTPVVHHWEGKTALVWGLSRRITNDELPPEACISVESIVDLTDNISPDGSLNWQAPEGENWKILRLGYTTMGRTNGSGVGQGLESDKFSARGARVAFDGWYARVLDDIGPRLSGNVLKMLNVDSWECGSQNWSPVMRHEFRSRRGYDVKHYLPAMAGIPVGSAETTEGFLFDLRRTIADLISENYVGTLNKLALARGSQIQMEAVPPGMMCDGLSVHKHVDVSAGEFWVTAWQNWKPCDIAEATHAANIYGKNIAMAEAFTGGGDWKEHPYDLKAMGDLHYADGINRFMLHLWAAQPYPGRVPGQTGAAGTYFNQHNTWIAPGKAWFDYLKRCQYVLQSGRPVKDVAYFIGEDVPGRALIPPRYGTYFVTDPPLPEGYAYDSINRDVLLNQSRVEDGMLVLDSGARYKVLVLHPDRRLTPHLINKVRELVGAGLTVVGPKPVGAPGLEMSEVANDVVNHVADEVWGNLNGSGVTSNTYRNGRVHWGAQMDDVLSSVSMTPDLLFHDTTVTETGEPYAADSFEPHGFDPTLYGPARTGWGLMWSHRRDGETDFYFLSNQEQFGLSTRVSFRVDGRIPELWHPDTGTIEEAPIWQISGGHTIVPVDFDPAGSLFVVFRKPAVDVDPIVSIDTASGNSAESLRLKVTPTGVEHWASAAGTWTLQTASGKAIRMSIDEVPAPIPVSGNWSVQYPLLTGEQKVVNLPPASWTEHRDGDIRHFSGTATYSKQVSIDAHYLESNHKLHLDLGDVKNLARVRLNGTDLGVTWKPPYRVEITPTARAGENLIEIEITNTWFNRLVGDANLPEEARRTWVLGSTPSADADLEPAGLLGPVSILSEVKI